MKTAIVKTSRPIPERKSPGRKPTEMDHVVGRQLRAARKERGLTQEQLANQVGLTFQQIQKYEKAVNRVSAGLLYELSLVLDKPLTYFFDLPESAIQTSRAKMAKG